jgi:hypothetical protein
MFRKTMIALAAVGALGAAALAPTAASAHWQGGWHGGWHGWGPHFGLYVGPTYYNPCMHRQWIDTPYGPRLRWVNVCY